ncbi:hypothetical protein AM571_CH03650 [Rhizobium etli 8C-3]|uniref:Uncharacterized protein n=1 Tax=Rhizobium etli 8C-3 TaxID=538025 RepID=A0A1L5P8G3_RHIET|nr:hypothetical protein AM571_CH03650 [Rhizobium etli 8C-3]
MAIEPQAFHGFLCLKRIVTALTRKVRMYLNGALAWASTGHDLVDVTIKFFVALC